MSDQKLKLEVNDLKISFRTNKRLDANYRRGIPCPSWR